MNLIFEDIFFTCFEENIWTWIWNDTYAFWLMCAVCIFSPTAALEGAIEALSSGGTIELPLARPQLTLLQDYGQPLERFDDYEDDEGELRAESNLAEKFGEFPHRH